MEHTIRDFTESDRKDYLRMSAAFYASSAVDHTVPESHFHATFDQCVQGSPYTRGLMLLCDGAAAGYALLSVTWSNEAGGKCIFLEEAYVLPAYQGKGLGSAFLAFVEETYGSDIKRLRLEVTPANTRAVKLYERMGYQRLDYIQMVKDLVRNTK